jgi:hypothetical protein
MGGRIMNSGCSEHQKNIAAHFLGDLDERERQALEAHLATCSQCRSEQEGYARTMQQLASVGEEEIPRHFFIYPEATVSNPWQLYRRMSVGWQTASACVVALMLFFGIAAISRLQIRSNPDGWTMSFGGSYLDAGALKKEILEAAKRNNEKAMVGWVNEVRSELSQSHDKLTQQQQIQLTAALARMDAQLTRRIKSSEGHVKDDTHTLVTDLYRVFTQQRARDLEAINLRLDSTDANNAIKTRQTTEILGTLLQVADLKLK